MGKCIVCGKETADYIHTLEVRTLHVRDMDRAKRVQALGSFQDFYVCENCAHTREQLERLPVRAASPKLIGFGLTMLAGVALLTADLAYLGGDRVFFLLALAAIACGILGLIQTLSDARERSRDLGTMTPEQARLEGALSLIRDYAPKKSGEEDLTYIPVTGKTLQMKNGDLMVMYNLLPEIAVEAWKRIRQNRTGGR